MIHIVGLMRTITKDIQLNIDGSPLSFRLTKPDTFSGVEILRLLLLLQDQRRETEQGDVFCKEAGDVYMQQNNSGNRQKDD